MKHRQIRNVILAAAALAGTALSQNVATVSNGNWTPIVAPDSIAAAFGSGFSTQTYSSLGQPLPTTLGGTMLSVTDSAMAKSAAGLFMVSFGQINFLVPSGAVGKGTVAVTGPGGSGSTGPIFISNVAPAVFTANESGTGPAAAQFLRVTPGGGYEYINTFTGGASGYQNLPVSLSPSSNMVYLVLYGTGVRHHSLNPVQATISGTKVPVLYAGPVTAYSGLDQINIGPLPQSLAGTGKGDVTVQVTVDGVPANPITINIQ